MEIFELISFVVGLIGIAVIAWGVLLNSIKFVSLEFKRLKRINICNQRENLRHHLGSYILLGLEFLIAADIVRTALNPELKELTALGAIVLIRTVLNYFLNKELEGHHNCKIKQ